MSENVAQTVQKVIQDLVAPDVRELKASVVNLQRQVDDLRKHMDQRFDAQDHFADLREKKLDAKFDSLMSAIKEGKAQSELATLRMVAPLSERVAVLESVKQ